jgi:hypothetical protein
MPTADDVAQIAKFTKAHSLDAALKAQLTDLANTPKWANLMKRLTALKKAVEGSGP